MAVHPAARRRPKPGSGPRRHDGCGYFIASVTHRTTLPVPQPPCAIASERWCYAAHPAELTSSKTARATLRRLLSSIHHLLRRSAHHSPALPRRQIAIDGHRPRRPPRVPSLQTFGRRPSARMDRSRRAAIRNPSQSFAFVERPRSGRCAPKPAVGVTKKRRQGSTPCRHLHRIFVALNPLSLWSPVTVAKFLTNATFLLFAGGNSRAYAN